MGKRDRFVCFIRSHWFQKIMNEKHVIMESLPFQKRFEREREAVFQFIRTILDASLQEVEKIINMIKKQKTFRLLTPPVI